MCRRAHGAAFVTWVGVEAARLRVTSGEAALVRFASSPGATRSFCGTCGSALFFESKRWAGEIHVARANVEGALDREASAHAFFDSGAPWVHVDDGLPRFGGTSGTEPLPAP